MKVRDAMAADVEALSADDSIVSAARLMGRAGTGFLPVLAAGHPVGVLTDRDIVVRFVAGGGADPSATPVSEVMTSIEYGRFLIFSATRDPVLVIEAP